MPPPQAHKDWATLLRDRLGGIASVVTYLDDLKTSRIPIFSSENPSGLVVATVGLMDIDQNEDGGPELRTEVMMHSRGNDPLVCNVLSTIAFYVIKDGWRVRPGTVFENQLPMYFPETRLPHVLFTAPFEWERWGSITLEDRLLHPLVAIPVSDAEMHLLTNSSAQDLEAVWRAQGADLQDWRRESAV